MQRPLVMVVDDDRMLLDLMDELLTDEGYRPLVAIASNGAAAMAARERPALVILDVRMEEPEAGLRVLAELRHDPRTARVPIMLFTADHTYVRNEGERLRAEGVEIVEKPFEIDDLLHQIRRLVRDESGEQSSQPVVLG